MIGVKNRVRSFTALVRRVFRDRISVLINLFNIFFAHAHKQFDAKLLGQL